MDKFFDEAMKAMNNNEFHKAYRYFKLDFY